MKKKLNSDNTISQGFNLLLAWLVAVVLIGFAGLVSVGDIWAQVPDGTSAAESGSSVAAESINPGASDSEQALDGTGETSLSAVPAAPGVAQAEAGNNGVAVADAGDISAATCKGLKPYNDIDELLYQFYINLDSDCLFTMSTAELEEIWGIKILDEERFKPQNYYPLAETDFYFKPYKSEKDAFYIERTQCIKGNSACREYSTTIFKVRPTKEYFKMYGTLFSDKKMPELLPNPNTAYNVSESLNSCTFPHFYRSEHTVKRCAYPAWQSSDNKRAISLNDANEIWFKLNFLIPEEKSKKASVNVKNALCRGLKPIKDVDDLLYQFYINFDTDCLFTMPTAELEKIWGVKLYNNDPDNSKPIKLEELNSIYVNNPEYFYMPGDADFGVIVRKNVLENKTSSFTIRMTKAHKDKQDTFFPGNKIYPIFLPAPEMRMKPYHGSSRRAYNEMKNLPHLTQNEVKEKSDPFDVIPDSFFEELYKEASDCVSKNKNLTDNYSIILSNSDKTHEILYRETNITIK